MIVNIYNYHIHRNEKGAAGEAVSAGEIVVTEETLTTKRGGWITCPQSKVWRLRILMMVPLGA